MTDKINLNNIQTAALQLARQLDSADKNEDGKISASIWNDFVADKGGKEVQEYISISDAVKSITTYAAKISKKTGEAMGSLLEYWNTKESLKPSTEVTIGEFHDNRWNQLKESLKPSTEVTIGEFNEKDKKTNNRTNGTTPHRPRARYSKDYKFVDSAYINAYSKNPKQDGELLNAANDFLVSITNMDQLPDVSNEGDRKLMKLSGGRSICVEYKDGEISKILVNINPSLHKTQNDTSEDSYELIFDKNGVLITESNSTLPDGKGYEFEFLKPLIEDIFNE